MKEKQFQAVLKRSVSMFNMLTGRDLTEREGSAFIQIFDLVDEFHTPGAAGAAVDAFNTLSMVEPKPGLRDRPAADALAELDIPTFVKPAEAVLHDAMRTGAGFMKVSDIGVTHVPREEVLKAPEPKSEPVDICGCPFGKCTCTDDMLAKVAKTGSREYVPVALRETLNLGAEAKAQKERRERYVPPPIRNDSRDHIPGYDWQIVVLSREKCTEQSYMVHFAQMPTQAEFAEHFRHYHARTHYVHVNEWVNWGWESITSRYDTSVPTHELRAPNKVVRKAEAPELKGRDVSMPPLTMLWEEPDKPYRIRYFSDEMGFVRFTYVDKKPTSAEMAHFHHTKCLAVSQAKPKD